MRAAVVSVWVGLVSFSVGCANPECPEGRQKIGKVCVRSSSRDAGPTASGLVDAGTDSNQQLTSYDDAAFASEASMGEVEDLSTTDASSTPADAGAETSDASSSTLSNLTDSGTASVSGTVDATIAATNEPEHIADAPVDAQPPACVPSMEVCDGKDNNCNGMIDEGVLNACGSCGTVPAEVCDGKDNNCNGMIDEGVLNACSSCGAVPAEVCDGKDNDCNGKLDDLPGSVQWYRDCDGDGFAASKTNSIASCSKPAPVGTCMSWVDVEPVNTTTTDCDDNNSAYHPGASYGIPTGANTSNDLNCDGTTSVQAGLTGVSGGSFNICQYLISCDCYVVSSRGGKQPAEWVAWYTSGRPNLVMSPPIPCSASAEDRIQMYHYTFGPEKLFPEQPCGTAVTRDPTTGVSTPITTDAYQYCR
jgi:hypothetical protein